MHSLDGYSDDTRSRRSANSRAIYDEAQLRSSSRSGSILYGGGGSRGSGMSTTRRTFQQSFTTASSHNGLRSSLRSSSLSGSGIANKNDDNPSSYYPINYPGSVSLSGNSLLHIQINEESELELDKEEMKQLANSSRDSDNGDLGMMMDADEYFQNLSSNDTSTIGTTHSTQKSLLANNKNSSSGKKGGGGIGQQQLNVVDGNPNNHALILNHHDDDGGHQHDDDDARKKIERIIFSPPFQRTVFLSVCFVLLGLGVVLTMENFMRVRTAQDWLEPNRDRKYNNMYGDQGGIDWTFGSDAPKPIAGAAIDYSVESYISDWARGTSRVPATNPASRDGYGSVALTETVMFKDVPLFWGLPFAGGYILESVLGQCLNLVQASDGRGMDSDENNGGSSQSSGGRGSNELHLTTIFVMGQKYLNVDLSTMEGIDRASALALGTSGMADVVYSYGNLLHEVADLFSTMNQGRLFIMVRHPVERELARFHHLLRGDDNNMLSESDRAMSYAEFAHSDHVADNWMTRTLVQKGEDEELTAKDMHTAKEILRRKALVGLYSDMIGAVRHYARYFGWDNAMNGGKLNKVTLSCFESAILEGMAKDSHHGSMTLASDDAQEGSVAWRRIMEKNRFDFELYVYSQQLYKFQIALS